MVGQPTPEEAIGGAAVQAAIDPNAVSATPQQSTRPAMENPMGQPVGVDTGPSASYRATIKAPRYGARVTKDDFISDPRNITVDGHTFSQASFELPASAIGLRLDEISTQQEQVRKGLAQLTQSDKKPAVVAPYARSYQSMVSKAQQDYIDSVAAQYGGNTSLAYKAITGQDPDNLQAMRGWEQLGADMDGLGQAINYDYGLAERYFKAANDGTEVYDQELFDTSKKLMRGMNELGPGGLGDVQALTTLKEDFRQKLALPKFLKESGIDAHVKEFMGQNYRNVKMDKRGQFTVFSHEDVQSAEAMIDSLAEDNYDRFDDIYPTLDAFKAKLHTLYPVKVELKETIKTNPQPRKGKEAKRSGWNNGAFEQNGIRMVPSVHSRPGVTSAGEETSDRQDRIRLYRDQNGEQIDLKPQEYLDRQGTPVFIKPTQLVKEKGAWYIEGPGFARPREKDLTGKAAPGFETPEDGQDAPVSEMEFLRLPTLRVPLDANPEFIQNYGDPDKVMEYYRSGNRPTTVLSQPAPAANAPKTLMPWEENYKK